MLRMKNNLVLIKDKFNKIDIDTTNRTLEINKEIKKRNASNKI